MSFDRNSYNLIKSSHFIWWHFFSHSTLLDITKNYLILLKFDLIWSILFSCLSHIFPLGWIFSTFHNLVSSYHNLLYLITWHGILFYFTPLHLILFTPHFHRLPFISFGSICFRFGCKWCTYKIFHGIVNFYMLVAIWLDAVWYHLMWFNRMYLDRAQFHPICIDWIPYSKVIND